MGRIKDLVIDLQNEYGINMEFLPEDFNMDEYLYKKSLEISNDKEELFCKQLKSKNITK